MSAYYIMKCLENPPNDKLKLLEKMGLEDYAKLKQKKKYSVKDKKQHYLKIRDYIKRHKKLGAIEYEYNYNSEKMEQDLQGRRTNSKSLQQIDSHICNYLLKDIGTDIDIVNSGYSVVRYLLIKHKISLTLFPTFVDYLENRESWLNEIPNCKDCLIAYLFDEKPKYQKNEKLKLIKIEMRTIISTIVGQTEYEDYLEKACIEKEKNKLGCAMNAIYHKVENEILQYVIELFKEKNINCITPKFDGAIFEGKITDIADINEKVNEKFSGVKLIVKPMNTDLTDTYLMGCDGDEMTLKEIAMSILDTNKEYFQYLNDELIAYNYKTGIWEESMKKVKSIIYDLCPCEQNPALIDKLYTMILFEVMNDESKEGWYEKSENTSLKKLLFKNGYMFIDGFIKQDPKFNPSIMFRNRLLFDLPNGENNFNTDIMEDIKERFFYNTLGKEVGDYFMELLARGLFGEVMKKIVFCLGNSNTGKSTLVKAFQESFGDLVGSFNGETLAKSNTSQEEAQIMRPFYLVKDKRLIFSNELKMSANLEGNAIKKISSGGDKLVARKHCGNETPFVPHFLTLLMANDIAEISNYDDALETRINIIHYTKPFKLVVEDAENELQADANIEEEMRTDEFKWNFVGIFLQVYQNYLDNGEKPVPQILIENRKKWINKHASVITLFLETFEITDNLEDYITCNDLKEWIKTNKTGISDNKLGIELSQYAKKKKFDNVISKNKKIDKKATRVWIGIKFQE